MSNNFLDNYKKKSEQDITELTKNVIQNAEAEPNTAVPQPSAAPNGQTVGQSKPATVPNGQAAAQNKPATVPNGQAAAQSKSATVPNGQAAVQSKSATVDGMSFEQKSTFVKPVTATAPTPPPSNDNIFKNIPKYVYVIAAAVIVAIIIAIVLLTGGTTSPAMVGKSLSDAELWANENKVLLTSEKEYSDEVEEGKIISQTPAEGEKIDGGGFLEVVLSLGPDPEIMIAIPTNFMEMSMTEVDAWAEENLMSAVRVTTDESDTVEQGVMIKYTINDNTVLGNEIRRDSPLYVVFSKGAGEGEPVKLPNFLTMSLDEVEKFGEDNDILIKIEEIYHDTIAKGMVISQSVKAEEEVRTGDTVTVEVSKGKEILVPNFFSYDRERAAMIAAQEGITTLVKEKYSTLEKDKLISQSMSAGSLYDDDDILELTYSLGNSFVLPSFIGSNETSVREWVTPKNEDGASIVVNTRYTVSDKAKGTVLSQEAYDITVGISFTINLVVSSGGIVYAPDLVDDTGLEPVTREMAIQICADLGIVPVFTERSHGSRFWPGEVWAQNIPAGTEMKEGGVIELTVNPLDVGTRVPNFVDLTEAEARANADGLTVKIVVGDYVSGKAGMVTKQSLTAGTMVAPGSIIELTIAGQPTVPSFIGLTKAEVEKLSLVVSGEIIPNFDYGSATDDGTYEVTAQSPSFGSTIPSNKVVTLTMAAPTP